MAWVSVQARGHKEIARDLGAFAAETDRVLYRSVNTTGRQTKTYVSREIRKELNIKAGDLRQRNLRVDLARSGSSPGARLVISGARIPLIRFNARQTRRGTSYKISRTAGRKTARSAFTTMTSGHEGVFTRIGSDRLPIRELLGPSVPTVAKNIAALSPGPLNKLVGSRLERNTDLKIREIMDRKLRKGKV